MPRRLHWKTSSRRQLKLQYFKPSSEQSGCQPELFRAVTMTQMCHVLQSHRERQQPPSSRRRLRGVSAFGLSPVMLTADLLSARFSSSMQQWCVLQTSDCTTTAVVGLKSTSFAAPIISNEAVSARRSDPQAALRWKTDWNVGTATKFHQHLYILICWRHNSKLFLSLFIIL